MSSEIEHHFALTTLFEIIDVGGRSDLKSDILKELERHKQQFSSYRGNPSVSEAVLNELLGNIEKCLQGFNTQAARLSQCVTESDFLSSLRNRVAVPGGTWVGRAVVGAAGATEGGWEGAVAWHIGGDGRGRGTVEAAVVACWW